VLRVRRQCVRRQTRGLPATHRGRPATGHFLDADQPLPPARRQRPAAALASSPDQRRPSMNLPSEATPSKLRILLLEDNASHAEIVEHVLKEGDLDFTLTRVETRDTFEDELEHNVPDLILSDYALPSFDGYT